METSNQNEDSSTPYGYEEPPQQGQEHGQEFPPEPDASWGWQPTPPVTRATAAFEVPEQPEPEEQPAYYAAPQPQPLTFPLPEPAQPQHFYAPKVQPIQRPQPTPTQPLEQAPAPQPVPAPPTPTQRVPQPSSQGGTASARRRAILHEESEKAEQLGLSGARATTSYMVSGVRHANKRRSNSLIKLLGLVFLVNLLIVGAFGAWLYNYFVTQVETRMSDFAGRPQANGSLATARSPLAASTGGATAVEVKQLQDDFDKRFSDLKAQLQAAQSRITEFESAQQQQQTRMSALASQMANAAGEAATTAGPGEAVAAAVVPGVESEIAPSANELILLKERNRLTSYADEAIASGAREPYERLWEALEDPRLIKLIHAARAEILRVQNFYLSGTRIESYTIQVGDYFPENAALKDSQLRDEQLIELLEKKENPWQVRMKAANLLGLRRSRAVGDALVRAVKYDPNLDVVKEATFSFEQMSGYRARIFEPASMDAWWTQYNAGPASTANAKSTTAAVDTTSAEETKPSRKNAPPPQAVPVPSPGTVKEAQPELRLPEWDEEQEARERANKAVADQQKAREKKDAEKQAAANAANEEKAPEKKKRSE